MTFIIYSCQKKVKILCQLKRIPSFSLEKVVPDIKERLRGGQSKKEREFVWILRMIFLRIPFNPDI